MISNPTMSHNPNLVVPYTYGQTRAALGSHNSYTGVSGQNVVWFNFRVPDDFSSLTKAYALVVYKGTATGLNWDLYSQYGANGEAYTQHSESDTASTYGATTDEILEVDVSGVLSSLAAGDMVGLRLINNEATILHGLGLFLEHL